jgi:SAM-dependent methyltransferase
MDVRSYNRRAWDAAVDRRSEWTVPVGPEIIAAARRGEWAIILTPEKPVPRGWFPASMTGVRVLCLASGGGQQAPVLAATGAQVTVLDNSPRQLAQDQLVAKREGLEIRTLEGDMADLSPFDEGEFDLIVHPVSNVFAPDVRKVWREAFRVLRPGGTMMAGFTNPTLYLFDAALHDEGVLTVRHKLPYSDLESLDDAERQRYVDDLQPLEYSHTLEDQIGGQLDAGFVLIGFYEDGWTGVTLSDYMPIFAATHALKPRQPLSDSRTEKEA